MYCEIQLYILPVYFQPLTSFSKIEIFDVFDSQLRGGLYNLTQQASKGRNNDIYNHVLLHSMLYSSLTEYASSLTKLSFTTTPW